MRAGERVRRRGPAHHPGLLAVVGAGLLVLFVGFLLLDDYRARRTAREIVLSDCAERTRDLSSRLSYFFAERTEDLETLADSREVQSYFENRALGLSLEYGLRFTLADIDSSLARFVRRRTANGWAIYRSIELYDEEARLLARSGALAATGEPSPAALSGEPERENHVFYADGNGGGTRVAARCSFKGSSTGWVVATLNDDCLRHQMSSESSRGRPLLVLLRGSDELLSSAHAWDKKLVAGALARLPAEPNRPIVVNGLFQGRTLDWIAVRGQVEGTPFTLVHLHRLDELLRGAHPRQALLGLIALAIALLGGTLALTRSGTRNLVLSARLKEQANQQHEIEARNASLSREIQQRIAVENDLRRSEVRFRELSDSLPLTVFESEPDGCLTYGNETLFWMFGCTPAELAAGINLFEFLAPEEHPRVMRLMQSLLEGTVGVIGPEEFQGLTRKLERLPILVYVTPRRCDGRVVGVRGVVIDIRERVRAERELRKAMEAAEGASRAKSAFLANMSHEIRTPMNAVIGLTELTLESELDEIQRQNLTMVLQSGRALLDLINGVLDLSKIEAGKLELVNGPVELRALLEVTLAPFQAAIQGLPVTLRLSVADDVPDGVLADSVRLRQILINLVGNAIKFTPSGAVEVLVNLEERCGEEMRLCLTVRDTGIGIPADKLRVIFEEFEQADGTTTRQYGGTGLGLSIARRLIDLMGGQIRVESTPGRGTTFICSLRVGVQAERRAA